MHARREFRYWLFVCGILSSTPSLAASAPAEAERQPDPRSEFWSQEDGWLDISPFIDRAYGFVPLLVPITEPAVGAGAAAAAVFIDKPEDRPNRPDISVVGALRTNNGTDGAFAGDLRHWRGGRLKTLAGVVSASIHLDFYGLGRDPLLEDDPRSFVLDTDGALLQARQRIGDSSAWAGIGYVLASTTVSFDVLPPLQSLPDFERDSRVGGLLPTVSLDTRDNVFTPTAGDYLELSAGLFAKALGSDGNFQRVGLTGIHYQALADPLTLGIIGSSILSYGDVPFYLRPFIMLRGAPAMRYQGDHTAQVETELRWQFFKRLSLVGFAGAGRAWNDDAGRASHDIVTGGLGFRYEIARKYGLHIGIDAAHGPDGMAYYVQFGSAWLRP